jgi:hypothetical protein
LAFSASTPLLMIRPPFSTGRACRASRVRLHHVPGDELPNVDKIIRTLSLVPQIVVLP